MTLGETIKSIRESHKMKAKDLAYLLDIRNTYLSSIENNRKQPTLNMLRKIAMHFEMPLSKIFLLQENSIQ